MSAIPSIIVQVFNLKFGRIVFLASASSINASSALFVERQFWQVQEGSNTVLVAEAGQSQHSTDKDIMFKFVTGRLV